MHDVKMMAMTLEEKAKAYIEHVLAEKVKDLNDVIQHYEGEVDARDREARAFKAAWAEFQDKTKFFESKVKDWMMSC